MPIVAKAPMHQFPVPHVIHMIEAPCCGALTCEGCDYHDCGEADQIDTDLRWDLP